MGLLSIFELRSLLTFHCIYVIKKKVNIGILKSKSKDCLLYFTSGVAQGNMDAFRRENCSDRLFCYINMWETSISTVYFRKICQYFVFPITGVGWVSLK